MTEEQKQELWYVQTIDRNKREVGLHENMAEGSVSLVVPFSGLVDWVWDYNGEPVTKNDPATWGIFDVAGMAMRLRAPGDPKP
jgi:hypothetical protein